MGDKFEGAVYDLNSIPANIQSITPSDTVDLPNVTRRIYIGTGGDIKVTAKESGTVTYKNMPAGYMEGAFTRVWATPDGGGTPAADLIAEW
ncbi:spike base protein, RCAP_Rcc01079 family [Geopsychrobacter electrodiphilus]|uniref:spike base protein, RCAP_Rcc01079 family n=1 Tax=Geopsychrobacter electrodiphilus TaxID=225196 RepID=UPI00035D3659|nr:hypothetical protein [Geopsychrobacter electrodiphilus]